MARANRWRAKDISSEMSLTSRDEYGPSDDRSLIENALSTLSPDHQIVIALRYYRDLTVEDIAAQLGVPRGTVQSRLHYALRRLHAAMDTTADTGTEK